MHGSVSFGPFLNTDALVAPFALYLAFRPGRSFMTQEIVDQ
jgi:hypothetical protein